MRRRPVCGWHVPPAHLRLLRSLRGARHRVLEHPWGCGTEVTAAVARRDASLGETADRRDAAVEGKAARTRLWMALGTGALANLFIACGSAGTAENGDGSNPPVAGDDQPAAPAEVLRDSCRRVCGTVEVLRPECTPGEVASRGVLLGRDPVPDEPPKSYDVACIDECMDFDESKWCWQQVVESTECLAWDALFVCAGPKEGGGWNVYGCERAGEDPSVCDLRG
jgi:hypothetical protein